MQALDIKHLNILREFVRKNRKNGVIGFSPSPEEGVIRIFVEHEKAIEKVSIPHIEGYGFEIVISGEFKALNQMDGEGRKGDDEDRTGFFDPLVAGISIGHYRITAGTLGWFGIKNGKAVIISNNHVLAWENRGKKGDKILQPGPYDINRHGWNIDDQKYVAGYLLGYVPISFERYRCPFRNTLYFVGKAMGIVKAKANVVDLAWALASRKSVYKILELNEIHGWATPKKGLKVVKSGRTTGVTSGVIDQTQYYGYVTYSRGIAWFEEQILIKSQGYAFSKGGDSGSIVLDEDGFFIGILFAGNEQYTVVNPAIYVLQYLNKNGIKMVHVER